MKDKNLVILVGRTASQVRYGSLPKGDGVISCSDFSIELKDTQGKIQREYVRALGDAAERMKDQTVGVLVGVEGRKSSVKPSDANKPGFIEAHLVTILE